MPRLTLRTLLAYLDDTLDAEEARDLGLKIAENPDVQQLIERIKRVTRRRGLGTPPPISEEDEVSDPNTVAAYLDNTLDSDSIKEFEAACLKTDALLAEVAACHQILTLVLTEPVRVPPPAYHRMYRLLPPPLANHQRKLSRVPALTLSPPPSPEAAEFEETDVALLLGLKRYDAHDTWRGKSTLIGAVVGCFALLTIAIWMALPSPSAYFARVTPAGDPAQATPQTADNLSPQSASSGQRDSKTQDFTSTTQEPNKQAKPDASLPPPAKEFPEQKEPFPEKKEPPLPEKQPEPHDFKPVLPPQPRREAIGKWSRPDPGILLVTRQLRADTPWLKMDENNPELFTNDIILALPGYKADLKLNNNDVELHLWGNVPEQYAAPGETPLEVRLQLHPPSPDFHVDLTLFAGRIYITCPKPDTHIRVRLNSGEVWDYHTRKENTEIMVQMHKTFVPGTPYAREGGESPRSSAVGMVTRGQVLFSATGRFRKFAAEANTIVSWDSISGQLTGPQPIPKGERRYERFPLLQAAEGKQIQEALADLARTHKEREGLRIHLESRLQAPPLPTNILPTMLAIYCYAAITEGPDSEVMAGNLFDLMADRDRPYARRAAITAVSAWLAREIHHTKIFWNVLTTKKQLSEEEADLILQLLRGYSSRQRPDAAAAAEQLVQLLNHPNLVVREAALGNLVAFFDPSLVTRKELIDIPLTQRDDASYRNYLMNWDRWLQEFKMNLRSTPTKQ
jgi:hypothetical protein